MEARRQVGGLKTLCFVLCSLQQPILLPVFVGPCQRLLSQPLVLLQEGKPLAVQAAAATRDGMRLSNDVVRLPCRLSDQSPVPKLRRSGSQSLDQAGASSGVASAYAGVRPSPEDAGERALREWAMAAVLADARVRGTISRVVRLKTWSDLVRGLR